MEYDFDVMLHRNIRQGNEFDKLIPAYSNTSINFEKSYKEILESDTFDTLKFINQWVDKYHGQMSKIAPLLKRKTTAETTENIYSWLYNHIQYKIDTSPLKQRLFSPAAAWYYRASGIDCKSFSLLASCILTELKLPHSLRMVKQKGVRSLTDPTKWIVNPNYWSHVYVVVPDGNKTLIIDATTHNNKEAEIVTKYDHNIMIHQGLNGAYTRQKNGLGCSCQGTSTQKNGLGNPSTLGFAITNFHKYLNELERKGVSRQVTDKMLSLVRYNVERGIDPNMEEILAKATNGGQLGSVFSDTINDIKGQVSTGVNNGISNISIGGVKGTDIFSAVSGDNAAMLSIGKNLINKVIPSNFMSSTFGAVFANGFDLSCWNASFPETWVKNNIEKDLAPHFDRLITSVKSATSVTDMYSKMNVLLKDTHVAAAMFQGMYDKKDWASCSKKGIRLYISYFNSLKNSAVATAKQLENEVYMMYNVPMTQDTLVVNGHQLVETGHVKPYSMVQLKLRDTNNPYINNVPTNPYNNPQNPSTGQAQVGDENGTNTGQNNTPPPIKKDDGISPVLLLTGVGIALKLLL